MNKKICIILGTRPEIIKMSPVIRECIRRKLNYFIIHTGQHYSYELDKVFFKELKLPKPKYNLEVGSGTHANQTSKIMIGCEEIFQKEKPDVVFMEGDTNSILGSALAASKLNIKVGHIEAGLRSYDNTMPEEKNRIIVDHISDYLFVPTKTSKQILLKEGIPRNKIFLVGNTIVDAIKRNLKIANQKTKVDFQNYILLTLHRPSNVDSEKKLREIIKALIEVNRTTDMPIIYPIHPRTYKMIRKYKIDIPLSIVLLHPFGYFKFLSYMKNANLIITDSGGIQEEACIMRVPCVTLRDNTERPETIKVSANVLANPKNLVKKVNIMLKKKKKWKNPFGENVAKKIMDVVR